MKICSGMISATEGQILIEGRDIRENTSDIQSKFGLCPQHNLLFTDLTVMQHLIFFGVVRKQNTLAFLLFHKTIGFQLRGLSFKAARVEGQKLLSKMNMFDKKKSLARQLSGGMQRKLCLAMALIGNAKVRENVKDSSIYRTK